MSHKTRKIRRIFYNISLALVDTWQDAFVKKSAQNLNSYVRWELFIVGILCLGIVQSTDIQLHWLVLLPLLSIYLISTAIIGYEPVYSLIQRIGAYLSRHWLALRHKPVTNTRSAHSLS